MHVKSRSWYTQITLTNKNGYYQTNDKPDTDSIKDLIITGSDRVDSAMGRQQSF